MLAPSNKSSAAARTRRYRERLRNGIALYTIGIDGSVFDMLLHFGLLDPTRIGDRNAVKAGLEKLLRRGLTALIELEARKKP
jgi:hypothetical protein